MQDKIINGLFDELCQVGNSLLSKGYSWEDVKSSQQFKNVKKKIANFYIISKKNVLSKKESK